MTNNLIYGIEAILLAQKYHYTFRKIIVSDKSQQAKKKFKQANLNFETELNENEDRLKHILQKHHAIAFIKENNNFNLKSLSQNKSEKAFYLMVDQIHDPQNFATLITTAASFQLDGVIYLNHHQAQVNDTVYKASKSISRIVPLFNISNLRQAIDLLKKQDFWIYSSWNSSSNIDLNNHQFPNRKVLIMGSEAKGIRPLIKQKSDFNIWLEIENVDSLNVAMATTVLLYEMS